MSNTVLAFLSEWLRQSKLPEKLDSISVKTLSEQAKFSKNLILERFLADQGLFFFARQAELRSDLKSLPRALHPAKLHPAKTPTISSLSLCTMASLALTSEALENFGEENGNHPDSRCCAQRLIDVPGMTFADYAWAISSSRKMRIEAIYI